MEVDQNEMPVVDTGRQLERINVKYKGAVVGYRKALVFYIGKASKCWIIGFYAGYKRDAKDNLRSRLSNEEQSAELDDQTADVVRMLTKIAILQPTQTNVRSCQFSRAMFAAANYGSYRTYATGMTPPMPEPVQIYPPEDIQIHPQRKSRYNPQRTSELKVSNQLLTILLISQKPPFLI
ncbi:hypothetical protein GH714_000660 [Hevea brasiliensis]|uniref:Uncharacterized protein n=1 Tax=Hevea brasiliensis TaxID=3981 RepID=A0A6A6KWB1_HEVBR|nr:hypothetical protein GH714_000660 [Hevea brasiliensis]